MKVVPQIITFLVLIAIGWLVYDSHDAFHNLVNDIADVSGISQELARTKGEQQALKAARKAGVPASRETKISAVASADHPSGMTQPKDMQPEQSISRPSAPEPRVVTQQEIIWPDDEPEQQSGSQADEVLSNNVATSEVQATDQVQESTSEKIAEAQSGEVSALGQYVSESEQTPEIDSAQAPGSTQQATGKSDSVQAESVPQEAIIEARRNQALSGLAQARATWHQGNHDKAINMYLELMQEFQNHPDFAGELGNIYFSKGQTELAVRAYSEAFFRLLKNNDHERAEQVLGIIYNIDQEQAALLNEYLTR